MIGLTIDRSDEFSLTNRVDKKPNRYFDPEDKHTHHGFPDSITILL